jgi:hypothetical protein
VSKVVKKIGGLFGGVDKPKTPDFAAQERKEKREKEEAARIAEEEARTRATGGQASTILTGGTGLLDDETESRRLLSGK